MTVNAVRQLIDAASISSPAAVKPLRFISRVAPLGHRLLPLLRWLTPDTGLMAVPFGSQHVVRPSCWTGPFAVEQILNLEACFPERHLFRSVLRTAPPGAILDVGANLGVYTLLIRTVTDARIIAYEPSPVAYSLYRRTLELNGIRDVDARPRACGDAASKVFLQEGINSDLGGLVRTHDPWAHSDVEQLLRDTRDGRCSIEVQQVTLDDDCREEPAIALIKVDCEGFEQRILQGARSLLDRHRPIVFVELHPDLILNWGGTPRALCSFLEEMSYSLECWTFQRRRSGGRLQRLLGKYGDAPATRYDGVEAMLADLQSSRPYQVYVVARPTRPAQP